MTYWWASQGETFSAIEEGTLWTCLLADDRALTSRTRIKELRMVTWSSTTRAVASGH
jgi:hypothetical protein